MVVSDDDTTGSDALTLTVANVEPAVDAGADDTINEGDTFVGGGSFSDPGADTWTATVDYGDGSGSQLLALNPDGSFSLSHTYADNLTADAPYTVTVTVTDDDGGVGSDTVAVSVLNVPPTVTLSGPASVTESSTAYQYGFLVTDPGADGFSLTEADISCGSGGALVAGSLSTVAGGGTFDCRFLDGPASPQLSISVVDDDGATDSDLLPVSVANVAPIYSTPQLDAAANQHATEGQAQNFDLGSFTDAGVNDQTWAIDVDWGDSGLSHFTAASQGAIDLTSHFYAQDGTFTVTVTVTDKDGGTDSDTFAIVVANVAPSVDAGGDATIDEGSSFSGAGSFSDPGADTWSATVDYGDGAGPVALSLNPDKTFSLSHTYAQDGSYTVTVVVGDDDESGTDTATVTVDNVAPTVEVGNDATIDEGGTFSQGGSFSDPGADTWSATVDYGDGDGPVALSLNPDQTFSLSHTYADNGSYTVTVVVNDDDTSGSDALTLTAENVEPAVDAGTDDTINEGDTFVGGGSFSDPGADTWTATVDYGDGSGSQLLALNPDGSFSLSHTYADNLTADAPYTVTVTVTDDDGGVGSDTVAVSVLNVPPTVTLSGPASVTESSTAYQYGFLVTDPGADGFSLTEADISCGSGGALVAGSLSTVAGGGTFDCRFLDGPASPQLSISVVDDDGATDSDLLPVSVANVAPIYSTPQLDAAANQHATEGQAQNFDLGSFTDAGVNDQTWAIDVDWGHSGLSHFTAASQGAIDLTSHFYAQDGTFTVTVTVTDKDGGTDSDTFAIVVANVPQRRRRRRRDD